MSADEYRAVLAALGLAQEDVGIILGSDPRNARRWASGKVQVPGAVAAMMRLWLSRPELVEVVRGFKQDKS